MPDVRTVQIPESVLLSAQSLDDLEDWLCAHDPQFIERMRRIRQEEDAPDKSRDLSELLERWPIE